MWKRRFVLTSVSRGRIHHGGEARHQVAGAGSWEVMWPPHEGSRVSELEVGRDKISHSLPSRSPSSHQSPPSKSSTSPQTIPPPGVPVFKCMCLWGDVSHSNHHISWDLEWDTNHKAWLKSLACFLNLIWNFYFERLSSFTTQALWTHYQISCFFKR